MTALHYFTGENVFQLREERRTWRERFAEKHGLENLLTLDAAAVTCGTLLDEVGTAPFLAEKRLVIVDGTPKLSKEEVDVIAANIHPDCVLLICDPKPDKRLAGTKALLKVATVKEFAPLDTRRLQGWMREYAARHGAALAEDAARRLLEIVGEDQEMLAREIEKLAIHPSGGAIGIDDVRALAVPSGEQEVWQLTNEIAQGRVTEALRYARTLLESGEDPFSLWSILLWMLRSLVSVAAAVEEGVRNPATIATSAGVPFPTARTLLPLAERMDRHRLRALVDWAAAADVDLKTGVLRATGEAPQEVTALVDEFILRCGALVPSKVSVTLSAV